MRRKTAAISDKAVDGGAEVLERRATAAALPQTREGLLPWLAAAAAISVTLGVVLLGGESATSAPIAALLVALCTTLAAAGLVAARRRNIHEATEREERARPARDQLFDLDRDADGAGVGPSSRSYVEGMERWATALLDLLVHAAEVTSDPELCQELLAAVEDTEALRDLLRSSLGRELNLNEAATLHSVCTLWETDQERLEQLAAEVDPAWHRRWRARAVVERLLRHGPRARSELVLPYRS